MFLLPTLICFHALLQASTSTSTTKPKPVDLKYSCISTISEEHQDQGSDNAPIIFLHGWNGNKETWNGIYEPVALATKRKACIVDLRNHGESPWNDEYDIVAMAEDVKHLLDRLKFPKVIMVGHSLGGKVSMHLTLNYPERVEKIVVEDIRPNGVTPEVLRETQIYSKVFKDLEKDVPQGVTTIESKKAFLKLLNEALRKLDPSVQLNDLAYVPIKCSNGICKYTTNIIIMDAFYRNVYDVLKKSYGRFDGPALFIYGGKSIHKVGDDESNIKKLFPKARLFEVPEAYHIVHTFKEFTTEVIEFINEECRAESLFMQ